MQCWVVDNLFLSFQTPRKQDYCVKSCSLILKYILGPREWHVSFICETFEGRCSPPLSPPLSWAALLLSLFRRSIPSSETCCRMGAFRGVINQLMGNRGRAWQMQPWPSLSSSWWVHSESPREGPGPAGWGVRVQGCVSVAPNLIFGTLPETCVSKKRSPRS